MPICKRDGFEVNPKETKNDTFHDNDMVFCCYITKRIFRDYDDYFRHVMAINSTVWQCEATGKDGLTYEEAMKSERAAHKKMEQFKQSLRAPVLLVIEAARQSAVNTLVLLVSKFLRKRYFLNEEIGFSQKRALYKVVGIIPVEGMAPPSNGVYEETEQLEYRLRAPNGEEISASFEQMRRSRVEFNMDNLTMFIKNSVQRVDGILHPKPEVYKQYVTDPKLNFGSIFIGKMPRYSPSKTKRPEPKDNSKKQSTLNKYIVKGEETNSSSNHNNSISKEDAKAKAQALAAEMERMRLEKQAKIEAQERQKAQLKLELMQRVNEEINYLTVKSDDLERTDQRVLPSFQPIVTLLPEPMLGDGFMLREFFHTYCGLLSGVEVFRNNLNFYELTRAFTAREVVGPLSDILLVLLGTIFDLQREEEEENSAQYLNGRLQEKNNLLEPIYSMYQASRTQNFVRRHYNFHLNELPLDALTLSEALRLHLLASGAVVTDRLERWRYSYRNGYNAREDPGLELRWKSPHILRALRSVPIGSLDFGDIMCIARCLMAQILTYSSTINIMEERMEQMAKAKNELRSLVHTENRRLAAVELSKRKLTNEHYQQMMTVDQPEQKTAMQTQLNKRIAEVCAQSDREHRKHEQQTLELHTQLFNFLVYLGMDRCYRKYYVLESMPGIFVEHAPDVDMDCCLTEPPVNKTAAELEKQAQLPTKRDKLRQHLLAEAKSQQSKPSVNGHQQSLENKENQENQHQTNGHAAAVEELADDPTPQQLLMCSGNPSNCIVHAAEHDERQTWSYIYKTEDIAALIAALNPLGRREGELKTELSQLRTLIEEHVKSCPVEMLSLNDERKRKKFTYNMHVETQRRYNQANFGLPEGTDLNEVMRLHLIDRILQFESDIYTGDLGKLKVKDMEKWRQQLLAGNYEPQAKLQWGLHSDVAQLHSGDEDEELDDEEAHLASSKHVYVDPGAQLEQKEPVVIPETQLTQVRNLCSALLQVEQSIGRRFLKEPFGSQKKDSAEQSKSEVRLQHWETSMMQCTSYAQVFLHLNVLNDCILWKRSTNKSLCKVCRRGSDPDKMLLCDECNGGTHMFCMKPKMRTVPEGNWYCRTCVEDLGLKNQNEQKSRASQRKRKFVEEEEEEEQEDDEEDEGVAEVNAGEEEEEAELSDAPDDKSEVSSEGKYNSKAARITRRRSARRLNSKEIEKAAQESDDEEVEEEQEEEEEEEEEAEEEQTKDEKVCLICFYDGCEVTCKRCDDCYHIECLNIKNKPRAQFVCKRCQQSGTPKQKRRTSRVDGHPDDDDDEPQSKRLRSTRGSRKSLDKSNNNNNTSSSNNNNNSTSNNNNNRRSGRRAHDNLPLNSAALYDLLEQTMKQKAAWPFLRPVLSSEVPDYYKIIKSPMDLAKIKSKLNMGQYQLNEELLSDIQLVFKNCDLYNVEGNEIYDAGCELERFVLARCKEMSLPFRPSDMNVDAC
ncbi:Acf1 [Drosophila busckii]|uniref:Acf1 n=1 Tax=Drosophila busckii TaxID=30019 RepID=A0A0M4EP62_DROBS|nr:bromodomain adjacent to zinc finger domain protein 1A [Drosophila busckii]ALC46588.1 Acf1 [Drosophila busckii]